MKREVTERWAGDANVALASRLATTFSSEETLARARSSPKCLALEGDAARATSESLLGESWKVNRQPASQSKEQ